MKFFIKSYKCEALQALNSGGNTYLVTGFTYSFWGLFKKEITISTVIPFNEPSKKYTNYWDDVIKKETFVNI